MTQKKSLVIGAAFSVLLVACGQPPITATDTSSPAEESGAKAEIDPNKVCSVPTLDDQLTRMLCKPGQRVAFLPQRWGNEQLPLYFAAANCDLRFSVAITNGGVVCQYMPQPQDTEAEVDGEPSTDAGTNEAEAKG